MFIALSSTPKAPTLKTASVPVTLKLPLTVRSLKIRTEPRTSTLPTESEASLAFGSIVIVPVSSLINGVVTDVVASSVFSVELDVESILNVPVPES